MKKSIEIIWLISILVVSICAATTDKKFPDFSLTSHDGNSTIVLSKVCAKGPVMITFWATWCKPCLKELRKLSEMQNFLDEHSITLIAICEDGPRTKAKVKPFVENENWKFIVAMDTDGKVKSSAGVADLPELFMLSGDRNIVYHHYGYKPGDELEYKEKIEALFPVKPAEENIEKK